MRGREWKCEEGLKNKKMKRKKKREEFAWWRVNQTWTAKLVWLQVKKTVWPRHDFFQQRQKLLDWCGVESPSPRSCRVVSYKRNLSLDRKVCNWGRLEPRTASKVRKHGRLEEEQRYSRMARCEYIWIIIFFTVFYFIYNGQTVLRAKDTPLNN